MRRFVLLASLLIGAVVGAQSPPFQRGDQVSVQNADGAAAEPSVQIVIALAGDRLRVDQSGVFVNDQRVTTLSPHLVEVLPKETSTIPAGHIFVAGEEHTATTMGRGWSLIPIVRVRKVGR